MRKAYPSLTVNIRATLTCFIALVAGAIALLSLGTTPAESQQNSAQPIYEVHDLGTLGGPESHGHGINDAGKVVGGSYTPSIEGIHAFLYSDGQMSDLGTLGGSYSAANAINDTDHVVGTSSTSGDAENHAFLYKDGNMTDLGTLGGSISDALAINSADQVVGGSLPSGDPPDGSHAFSYDSTNGMKDLGTLGEPNNERPPFSVATSINDAGKVVGFSTISGEYTYHAFSYDSTNGMKDLGTLGGTVSFANDINDAGKIVGSSTTSGDAKQPAVLYSSDGNITELGTLGGFYGVGLAINNADQVVGMSYKSDDGVEYPFLYSDGVMKDLNTLIPVDSGWTLTEVKDINDDGHIVGAGVNQEGELHAILLTPPYFDGFYQPVDNLPTLNKAKPGKTIPIRFSLGGDMGLDIFESGYPKSEAIACDSTATVDGIEETVTGKHGLSYNASTDTYEYDWATSSSWSGCRQLVVKLKNGADQRANFIFR